MNTKRLWKRIMKLLNKSIKRVDIKFRISMMVAGKWKIKQEQK